MSDLLDPSTFAGAVVYAAVLFGAAAAVAGVIGTSGDGELERRQVAIAARADSLPGPKKPPPPRTSPRSAKHADASGPVLWGEILGTIRTLPDGAARLSPDRESPCIGERRRAHSVASGTPTGRHAVAGYQRGVGTLGSLRAVHPRKCLSPRRMRSDRRFVELGMVAAF
jgi:hypothetical protein